MGDSSRIQSTREDTHVTFYARILVVAGSDIACLAVADLVSVAVVAPLGFSGLGFSQAIPLPHVPCDCTWSN